MSKLTWLSISLFCSKRNAHLLLKNGIEPFIRACAARNELQAWFFEINTLLGPNIRLPMLVPAGQAPVVANHAKEYFTACLAQLDCVQPPLQLRADELFMPFPENTVQFGLYSTQYTEAGAVQLSNSISEILLQLIAEDELDEDTLLTICLYLHLALVKAASELTPARGGLLESVYGNIPAGPPDAAVLAFLQAKLADNQPVLNEIARDVFYTPGFYRQHTWLAAWQQLCTDVMQKGDCLTGAATLIDSLNRQLGVSVTLYQLIQYFVLSYLQQHELPCRT